jgi:hypothetical protein
MNRTRQILVLTLVATALCADRVTTSTAEARAPLAAAADPIARLATKLGSRLSGSFCRESKAVCLQQSRRDENPVSLTTVPPAEPLALHAVETSPFQFRLPPPSL